VNLDAFTRELPRLFDDFPRSPHPRDRLLRAVQEGVRGLSAENNLALVNLAARCLEADESYVEVGVWQGRSLIAAGLRNDGVDLVGIDTFQFREGSREDLLDNLRRFGVERAQLLEGDVLELLRAEALAGRKVGVFYYDAAHRYRTQLEALRLAESQLAERALIIVDDSDWEEVGAATRDYVAGQPNARMLLEIEGSGKGQPQWWEGAQLVSWERVPAEAGREWSQAERRMRSAVTSAASGS
jgi:predicted O-methyltransferase YrrM